MVFSLRDHNLMTHGIGKSLTTSVIFRFLNNRLPHSDVEATLLHFILDVATSFGTGVAKDFGKDVFEGVVAHGTPGRFTRRRNSMVAVVGDVERSAETVAALLGGISVDAAQASDIFFSTQHAGDDDGMQGNLLDCQRVEEAAADVLQELARTGNQIRNAAAHGGVNGIIQVVADIQQFPFTRFGFVPVGHRADTMCPGGRILDILHIGEGVLIR